jgi:hypothetical protein
MAQSRAAGREEATMTSVARRTFGVGLLVGVAVVAGCAGLAPVPQPGDYPLHAVSPPFELSWRILEVPGSVRADGLIERQNPNVGTASLQLIGVDTAGQIVSFSAPIPVYWGSAWDAELFTAVLTPRGPVARYEVRVLSFEYTQGMRSSH